MVPHGPQQRERPFFMKALLRLGMVLAILSLMLLIIIIWYWHVKIQFGGYEGPLQ
jgi:hypothetical protein